MKVSEILRKTKKTLTAETWIQNAFARDGINGDGELVSVASAKAKSWCMAGALLRATGDYANSDLYRHAYNALEDEITSNLNLPAFNDEKCRTFEDIQTLFERAIKNAEEKEASP